MTDVTGNHAAKHAQRRSSNINGQEALVVFAPEISQTLRGVAAAVRFSPHFEDGFELLSSLKKLADGEMNVVMAMRLMKDITEGISRHTAATNDHSAENAWDEFGTELLNTAKPFKLTHNEPRKGP